MRRAGKADPAFIAQLRGKARVDPQVPRDVMTIRAKIAPAAALFNATFRGAAMEGNMSPRAKVQLLQRNFHNERLRDRTTGKPSGPNLKVTGSRYFRRNLDVVHKQIPEPPGAAAVRHSAAHKPHLVAPPHVWRGINGVEFGVVQGCSFARRRFLIAIICSLLSPADNSAQRSDSRDQATSTRP